MVPVEKMVVVDWLDPFCQSGWAPRGAAIAEARDRDLTCRTTGWLIEENDEYLLVAGSVGYGDDKDSLIGDVFKLPRCVVVSVRPLTAGSRRRT